MRWAFWRRSPADSNDDASRDARPLPDDVGLPTSEPVAAAAHDRDDDDRLGSGERPSPFSGATPDAAAAWISAGGGTGWPADVPLEPAATAPAVDPETQARCRAAVVDAVRAVLAADPSAVDAALAPADATLEGRAFATWAAGQALAARVPELSGACDAAAFGEDEHDLRRAYAELLAERSEPLRAQVAPDVPRELVLRVARVCALVVPGETAPDDSRVEAARPGDRPDDVDPAAAGGPVGWPATVLPGTGGDGLRAVCVLLAQTSRDGAPGPDSLADELRRTTC